MSIEKRAVNGTLVGAGVFVLNTLQTFVLVPVLLGHWGAQRYGCWVQLQSLLSLLMTLDAGHQQYVATELSKVYFGKRELLKTVLASGMWTATASGCLEIGIIVSLWVGGFLPYLTGLNSALLARERIPMGLLLLAISSVALNSICGMAVRLLPPAGKYTRYVFWANALRLSQAAAVAASAAFGYRILGAAVMSMVTALMLLLAMARDLRLQFPELWPLHRGGKVSLGLRHYSESLVLTGSGTLVSLQQNGLNMLVTSRLGAATLPMFSTVRTVTSAFYTAPNILALPLVPDMTRFHVAGEYSKLRATFAAQWLVGGSAIQIGMLATLPFLQPLYEVWIHHALVFNRALCALLAFAIAIRTFASPLQNYLYAINQLRAVTAFNAGQCLVAVLVAALTIPRFGVVGAGIGTLAGDLVGSSIVPMYFVARELPPVQRPGFLRDGAIALTPVAITGSCMLLYARSVPPVFVCVCGIALLLPLYVLQWRTLPAEVRVRVTSVLARLRRRLPGGSHLAN